MTQKTYGFPNGMKKKKNGKVATNVGAPLNTKGPNFISSISQVGDKEVLILGNRYGKDGRMFTGVSMATREGNTFSDPVDVGNRR